MSMLLSIALSNICGRKCGKQERISAEQQEYAREPFRCLDGGRSVTHCCSSTHHRHVESCCLRRWRISRESGSRRNWSGDRRFRRRNDQNQQIDWASRQQCCRVCCSSGSTAICNRAWRHNTPCVFRLRSSGQADDGGIHMSQLATLFSALDLPKIGPFARLLHIAHTS